MSDPRTFQVTLADGRVLLVDERGPRDGPVVISQHGTPSSRRSVLGGWSRPAEFGVRHVSYDRPGYGGSTPSAGRSVADAARDVEELADLLGVGSFAGIGMSGGGPHALACTALLGDRVTRTLVAVGAGPIHLPDFDWRAGMSPLNREEIDLALSDPAALERWIEREIDAEVGVDLALGSFLDALPPCDREVVQRPDVQAEERADNEACFAQRARGWLADDLALVGDWGFELSSITGPVSLWYGADDVLVPQSHGERLADLIPGAELHVLPGRGHWLDDEARSMYSWILRER